MAVGRNRNLLEYRQHVPLLSCVHEVTEGER